MNYCTLFAGLMGFCLLAAPSSTQSQSTNETPSTLTTGNAVALPLPIRVICGSNKAVGGFAPYQGTVDGSDNQADSEIDTGVAHAAPEAVYANEHYAGDFDYTFSVPTNGRYRVRLHFAEIFDSGKGTRVENIALNGQTVLTNLDIFAEAGLNKALVKEFPDVAPDAQGNIVVRISAATNSPDQNAKISGIEILRPQDADQTETADQFSIKTTDGKSEITIDTTAAPELKDWAENKLAPVLADEYPKIVALLPSDGFTAPARFKITIKPMDGVAYTVGTHVSVSSAWLKAEIHREAVGSLVHECVHVVQQYGHSYNGARAPGWIVEGMADYYRWFKYEPQSHGADIVYFRQVRNFTPRYDASYRISANFLDWATTKYDANLVTELNAAMRNGVYNPDIWKQHTGKTVQELGAEWKKAVEDQLAAK
jgi:hypothetical protein